MSFIKFGAYEDVKDHLGSITADEYAKVAAMMTIKSHPLMSISTSDQLDDPNITVMAMQIDDEGDLPDFDAGILAGAQATNAAEVAAMNGVDADILADVLATNAAEVAALNANRPVANAPVVNNPVANVPVANTMVANAPVANAPVANAPVANAPVANVPVANVMAAHAQATNARVVNNPVGNVRVVNAPAANARPVVANFDIEADLARIAQQTHVNNAALLPANFGDLVGEALGKYMAAHAEARRLRQAASNGNSNVSQPNVPLKDFRTFMHECATGNSQPAPLSPQQIQDAEDGISRKILRAPNSAYPITHVPTMSYDEMAARSRRSGYRGEYRNPEYPTRDIVAVKAQNRMELAFAKKALIEELAITTERYRRENDLNRVPMSAALELPHAPALPQQPSPMDADDEGATEPDVAPDLQGYMIHQQRLAQIPEDQIQPMSGPNAMADLFGARESRVGSAWNISIATERDLIENTDYTAIELTAAADARLTGPVPSTVVADYARDASARFANRRPVDLVPANAAVEGDVLLARPRFADEVRQRIPRYSDDPWESESPFEFSDDEVDEDVEMAEQ